MSRYRVGDWVRVVNLSDTVNSGHPIRKVTTFRVRDAVLDTDSGWLYQEGDTPIRFWFFEHELAPAPNPNDPT